MKVYGFFSSNSRPLYEDDIHAALSLPVGYVLQFRYNSAWIHPDILSDIDFLSYKRGVIFYTYITGDNSPENISVREVRIKKMVFEKDTEIYNCFLELGSFVDARIDGLSKKETPPHYFATIIELASSTATSWISRVHDLKDKLTFKSFINIKDLSDLHNTINLKYSDSDNGSYYELDDETEYFMTVNYADFTDSGLFNYVYDSTRIIVNAPSDFRLGAIKDTKTHSIVTLASGRERIFTYLKLKCHLKEVSSVDNSTKEQSIRLKIKKDIKRSAAFSVFFTIGALAILVGQTLSKSVVESFPKGSSLTILVISVIITILMSYLLYNMFDKK